MCVDRLPRKGRGKARAPADHYDTVQATFDRMVSRAIAIGSSTTGALIALVGLRFGSSALLALGAAAAAIGVWAIARFRAGTPNAAVLIAATVLSIGVTSLWVPTAATPAMAATVVLFSVAGVLLISPEQAGWYTALTLLAFAARPVQLLVTGTGTDTDLLTYLILLGVFAFGHGVLGQVGREARRTEARYHFLFEQAPVALWDNDFTAVTDWMARLRQKGITDLAAYLEAHPEQLDSAISSVSTRATNLAAANLLGVTDPDELIGGFPQAIIDDGARGVFRRQFLAMWDAVSTGEIEYTGVRVDGSEFQGVLTWASPTVDEIPGTRVVSAVADLTDLRRVEADLASTEMMQQALLHAIPDLLFICDADGTYLNYHVPERATSESTARREDLFVPPATFLGRRPRDVLPADLAEGMMIAIATSLETGTIQHFEYELPIAGTLRHWEMRVSPIEGEPRVLALVRDITEATKARTELQRLVESKDDFIAAVSHEIRTPLTGIVGFAHLLNGDQGELDPDERRSMIEALADQSADLTNIVEDLLVAAKADLGRLTVAEVPIDLRAQAAQVIEAWDPSRVYEPQVTGSSVRCIGDPHRVRQVIRNLLTNARRYGGDRIRIEIATGPAMGSVVVADNGPGIPSDQVEHAFLPYHRVAPRDGLTAALGIGLPISRTLARRMGGDLAYERARGETLFILTLPLANPVTQRSEGDESRPEAAAGLFERPATD